MDIYNILNIASFSLINIFIIFFLFLIFRLILVFKSKFIIFKKSSINRLHRKENQLKVNLAKKERLLELYFKLSQSQDSNELHSSITSMLGSLAKINEIKIFIRIKGSEQLKLINPEEETSLLTNFNQHPNSSDLKRNIINSFSNDGTFKEISWIPKGFVNAICVPAYNGQKFMGLAYLFLNSSNDSADLSSEIKDLIHIFMKLIRNEENNSTKDLMENMLEETGRFSASKDDVMEIGSMTLNKSRIEVLLNGNQVDVTGQEFNILELLAVKKGNFVTTDEFLKTAWAESNVSNAAVDIALFRLRQKLSKHKNGSKIIKNKTGQGYTLNIS